MAYFPLYLKPELRPNLRHLKSEVFYFLLSVFFLLYSNMSKKPKAKIEKKITVLSKKTLGDNLGLHFMNE